MATLFMGYLRAYNKLRCSRDFANVFSSHDRSSDGFFLFLAVNNNTELARLGLAVPKKNISKAVERNKIKRLIRESFRLRKERLKGKDIVVFVKKQFDIKQVKIEQMLTNHWDKIAK